MLCLQTTASENVYLLPPSPSKKEECSNGFDLSGEAQHKLVGSLDGQINPMSGNELTMKNVNYFHSGWYSGMTI